MAAYDVLQTQVADFLNRQDLTATIPSFISLAEARFNRELRTRDMIIRFSMAAAGQYTNLPADFREMKFIRLMNGAAPVDLRFQDQRSMVMRQAFYAGSPAMPIYYSLLGNTLELCPIPGSTYSIEIGYYANIPALTSAAPSNWLLVKHPDLYLYGALIQSAPYLKDDERLAMWGAMHDRTMASIDLEEEYASYSGATPHVSGRGIG